MSRLSPSAQRQLWAMEAMKVVNYLNSRIGSPRLNAPGGSDVADGEIGPRLSPAGGRNVSAGSSAPESAWESATQDHPFLQVDQNLSNSQLNESHQDMDERVQILERRLESLDEKLDSQITANKKQAERISDLEIEVEALKDSNKKQRKD